MGKESRRRGHDWERQIARDLGNHAKRTYEEREGGGRDVKTDLPFCIQAKAGSQPSPWKALKQACDAAKDTEHPVGALKFNHDARRDPENNRACLRAVVMRYEDWLEIINILKANGIIG